VETAYGRKQKARDRLALFAAIAAATAAGERN
jgi:hypothetical protein